MYGDFPVNKKEIEKALRHFLGNGKTTIIQESDFIVFSKSRRSKKFIAFFNRDENPEDIKEKISWDRFLIIASGSLSLSLEEDKDIGGPQIVLRFGKDRDGKQISYKDLDVFQCLSEKISKLQNRLDFDFVVKASYDGIKKNIPILVEKE